MVSYNEHPLLERSSSLAAAAPVPRPCHRMSLPEQAKTRSANLPPDSPQPQDALRRATSTVRPGQSREDSPGLTLKVIARRQDQVGRAHMASRASHFERGRPRQRPSTELAFAAKPFVAIAATSCWCKTKADRPEDAASKFVENVPLLERRHNGCIPPTHTSGIKDYLNDLRRDFPHDTPPEKIVRAALEAPLNFTPGEKWSYSNTGYVLLGMIIRKVSASPTMRFLARSRFSEPLSF